MQIFPTGSNPAYVSLIVAGALSTLTGILVAAIGAANERVAAIAASLVGVFHQPNPWPVVIGIVVAVLGVMLLAAALIIKAARPVPASKQADPRTAVDVADV
ncbi:putative membrane protein [Microbacterium sp. BE35]|uniref:hypothetical protein n=1 Tax=Microbacterium sp. BE35 TaxID=2817773 RepID=UPI00285C6914|nr:hypothetical protein [Microbacterium sp. BE35]MDR7189550.1 putative membrane protein [Microbacterium sp. BE35]